MPMGLCCCKNKGGVCYIKQASLSKTKYGYINLNGAGNTIPQPVPTNRRWLTLTVTYSGPLFYASGGGSAGISGTQVQVSTYNQLSGSVSTTVTSNPPGIGTTYEFGLGDFVFAYPGDGNTTLITETSWVWTDGSLTVDQELSNEYTDAEVFSDMTALLTPAIWTNTALGGSVVASYNNGVPKYIYSFTPSPSGNPSIGCLIPTNPYGGANEFQVAGCSGRINVNATASRFYPDSATDKACILVTYSDAGAGAALPPYANTCSLMSSNGSDSNGYYIQIMPTPILVVDDLRYYNTGSFMLNPYTNPNRSGLWTCNCDNLAP